MSTDQARATPSGDAAPIVLICPLDGGVRPERYRGVLTATERARIDALARPEARRRALVGRALLRLELAERLGCAPGAVEFDFGPAGKPCLAGGDAWHFNLSHSAGRVVLALAAHAPVGVDIEHRGRHARIEAIARHSFAGEECAELDALDDAERRAHFFRLWTVKEAVTKALGGSLWGMLPGIRLTGAGTPRAQLVLEGPAACAAPLAWWHFDAGDGYDLALARLGGASDRAPAVHRVIPGETRDPLPLHPGSAGVHAGAG